MISVKIASVILILLMTLCHVLKGFPHSDYLRMLSIISKTDFQQLFLNIYNEITNF